MINRIISVFLELFFLEMGQKRGIENYFILFIRQTLAKSVTTIIQTEVTKHMCQSTINQYNAKGIEKNLVPRLSPALTPKKSKESVLCASARGHLHLPLNEPIFEMLDRSSASHQAYHQHHHGARRFLLHAHATKHASSVEPPGRHAVMTHRR
jgi:hypothetical protein